MTTKDNHREPAACQHNTWMRFTSVTAVVQLTSELPDHNLIQALLSAWHKLPDRNATTDAPAPTWQARRPHIAALLLLHTTVATNELQPRVDLCCPRNGAGPSDSTSARGSQAAVAARCAQLHHPRPPHALLPLTQPQYTPLQNCWPGLPAKPFSPQPPCCCPKKPAYCGGACCGGACWPC